MRKSVQLHWIEQAEAREVLKRAVLHCATSEPFVRITYARRGPTAVDRLWGLLRTLQRLVTAIQLVLVKTMVWMGARSAVSELTFLGLDHDRILVAVLMTDIVDSTKRVAEIGDRAWRALLDQHNRMTRDHITRFGGREVGSRGDGFVAIFDSPTRAIHCAATIGASVASLDILLRSGIHVGEVYLDRTGISGLTAHIAARIVATAHPGEAIVSQLVCDLVDESECVFKDRGVHHLRGVPKEMHLYAI